MLADASWAGAHQLRLRVGRGLSEQPVAVRVSLDPLPLSAVCHPSPPLTSLLTDRRGRVCACVWTRSAAAHQGKKVQVRLGESNAYESVEVTVTHAESFDDLVRMTAHYWKLDGARYVVSDHNGVHFIRRMPVLEGLRMCPPGTQLVLVPLYSPEVRRSPCQCPLRALAGWWAGGWRWWGCGRGRLEEGGRRGGEDRRVQSAARCGAERWGVDDCTQYRS